MPPYDCVIAGHSHIAAFGVPALSADGSTGLIPVQHASGRFFGMVAGQVPRVGPYWQPLAELAAGKAVAIFWNGNQHLARYLVAPDSAFDVMLAEHPEMPVDPNARLVPERALSAQMAGDFHELDDAIATLRAGGALPVICGTPPPKGDDAFIRRMLAAEDHFINIAASMGLDIQTVPLATPVLRLKLWLIMQAALRDRARRHGVPFVPVPEAARTADGFLRMELAAADATHASWYYGEIMLEDLLTACVHGEAFGGR